MPGVRGKVAAGAKARLPFASRPVCAKTRGVLFVVQIVAHGLGLGLAALWPREARPLLNRESLVNVLTGAGLYGLKLVIGLTGVLGLNAGCFAVGGLTTGPIQALFAFLVVDLARYWLHRMHHRVAFFWQFHRVHHSVRSLDSTAGFRMHLVDFVQLSILPVLLFGVLFDTTRWEWWAVPVAMIPGVVADALEHSNTRWAPRNRALLYLFNNPLFHSWHHVRDAILCDGNYANALPVWDLLFRSNVTRPAPPDALGLPEDQDLASDALGLQLLRRAHP